MGEVIDILYHSSLVAAFIGQNRLHLNLSPYRSSTNPRSDGSGT